MSGRAGIVGAVGVLFAIGVPALAAPPLLDVPAIVARVLPAVASITTRHIDRETSPAPVLRRGLGSGVIVDRRGYIVTNHHVIEDAEQIKVTLPDERVFVAKLIGTDPVTDVAVIKIDADRLPVARLASSDHVRVGDPVVAIGNPLWIEGGPTVTAGVVSGLERVLEQPGLPALHHLIQTDAAINDGNSGGPLVNRSGQVIAINTALIPSAHGIGFAIPVATVRSVLSDLMAGRAIVRPSLGLTAVSVTPQVAFANDVKTERGVLVIDLDPAGAAAKAGIRAGDVITVLGGTTVRNLHDFHGALWRRQPGERVDLVVNRQGDVIVLRSVLGADRSHRPSRAPR